jgi:hypothetical protein
MAETETVPMDDSELFQSAMEDTEATPDTPEPEQPRDEHGRFAPKAAEPEPTEQAVAEVAPTEPDAKEDGQVPSWRLRELREARDAAEQKAQRESQERYALQQQFAQLQREMSTLKAPKPEPVDFFQNPDEAMNQRLAPVQSELQAATFNLRMEFSRELAVLKHGENVVAEVEDAVAKAMASNHPDMPTLAAQMRQSSNPVEAVIKWHQRNKMMDTTGGDLNKYREKVLEEAMKDPAFQAKVLEATRQTAPANPQFRVPPSLNKATGAGVSNVDPDDDASDAGIFRHAMAGGRR